MLRSIRNALFILLILCASAVACVSEGSRTKTGSATEQQASAEQAEPEKADSAGKAEDIIILGQNNPLEALPTEIADPATEQLEGLEKGTYALFDTTHGFFVARLFIDEAPITTKNFIELTEGRKAHRDPVTNHMVKTPLYNNRKVFRLIRGFMLQTGSADDTNRYRSGFTIPDEFKTGHRFEKAGILAMANTGRPNSGSSQFFVTFAPAQMLDGKYSIFGEVVKGMKTLRDMEKEPVRSNGRERSLPLKMPVIHSVSIHKIQTPAQP